MTKICSSVGLLISLKKMAIATDLEKLVSFRDHGDLCQAEFEKVKERLLSEEATSGSVGDETDQLPLRKQLKEDKPKRGLLIAVLSTIAAIFSAGSAVIDLSPLSLLAFALFIVASTLNWIQFIKPSQGRDN